MIEALVGTFALVFTALATNILVATLDVEPAGPRLVIAGASVVSMRDGDEDGRRTVIVQGDRITSIVEPTQYRFERGDVLVRADGLWLIPGLNAASVDSASPVTLRRLAFRGVTGVGMADADALTALAPLAVRNEARMPTLRRSPASSPVAHPGRRTDLAPPQDVVASLILAVTDAGATPRQTLRRLARDEALALGRPEAGILAAGFIADLVLLEDDPRNDLSALRSIRAVVLRGQLITRAEIDATEDIIAELAASASDPFRGAGPVREWPEAAMSRTFLLSLDGLPRGAAHSQVRTTADGAESHIQTAMWNPLHSTTMVTARHDPLGRMIAATVRHDSPVDALRASFEHIGDGWRIEVDIDGVEQSFLVDGELGASETVVLDLLPSAPDLRRIATHAGERLMIDAAEFAYGPIATTWGAMTLATNGAHPPPGRDVFELAVGTQVPAGGSLATVWTVPRTRGFPMLATDEARRAALRATRAVIGFDDFGWPIAAMVVVPDGLWEVHPLDAPKSVPDGSPRGNDAGQP